MIHLKHTINLVVISLLINPSTSFTHLSVYPYKELLKRSNEPVVSEQGTGVTPTTQEQEIIKYHQDTVSQGKELVNEDGSVTTVYSTGIQTPDGKFVAVPGYNRETGKIMSEEEAYNYWQKDIEAGKFPIYDTGEELNRRSQELHKLMEEPTSSVDIMDKIAQIESGNRHTDSRGNLIESPAGALGKYQIKPATARDPGFGITPIADLRTATEEEHRRFASDYYQAMLREFKGDEEKALAAYNSGHQTVKNAIKKYGNDWKKHIPQESKDYLQKISML